VLASGFADPAAACRPYDRNRNGFLPGEGAAILVLERSDQALARGRKPYAEWIAAGRASDPSGMTRVEREPVGLARLITDVLRRGQVAPAELDYINLHGTATRDNDLCETRALKLALGGEANRIPCSSLKGTIGHLLGAAGSVELAATLLALRDGQIPPTANLTDPDPECDLDYTPLAARARPLRTALKLSLGFGGHLIAAIVAELVRVRALCGS
jgi:3-oxoacyl-[acyl-carrier-protein] synthase II